jgi:hypothetical protein
VFAGTRPALLVSVANGLGKTTEIEYGTSTSEMLQAETGAPCQPNPVGAGFGQAWCSKAPTVFHMVKLGECVDENAADNVNSCAVSERGSGRVGERQIHSCVHRSRKSGCTCLAMVSCALS